MIVPVLLALGSAATFSVSTSVQHHAVDSAPEGVGLVGLLGYLIKRPLWLLGHVLAAAGFSLHALALHAGAIAVVQPIVVSGIIWAVPVRAAMNRHFPSRPELRGVVLTAVGLSVFLVASNPTAGATASRGFGSLLLVGIGAVLAVLSTVAASAVRTSARRRAFWLGVTAGVLFGLVAGLLKMSLQALDDGGLAGMFTAWPTYGVLVAGAGGVLTNQRAYQTAGLSASMPALNIVDVLVALVFGLTVFGEIPRHSPLMLAVQALALGCIGVGLVLLVRLEERFLQPEPTTEDSLAG
ncbi:MAG: DMT family transporter [Nocardioidaceae bacterium]